MWSEREGGREYAYLWDARLHGVVQCPLFHMFWHQFWVTVTQDVQGQLLVRTAQVITVWLALHCWRIGEQEKVAKRMKKLKSIGSGNIYTSAIPEQHYMLYCLYTQHCGYLNSVRLHTLSSP